MRILSVLLIVLLLAPVAGADALCVKTQKGRRVLGLPSSMGLVKITCDNYVLYVEDSKAKILANQYDGLKVKVKGKERLYAHSDVHSYEFTDLPEDFVEGKAQQGVRAYQQARRSFGALKDDPDAPTVFREAADFEYGMCLLGLGKRKSAKAHFGKWSHTASYYTPLVYELQAKLALIGEDFAGARARYKAIVLLPGIPQDWKYKGKLGDALVDLEEAKYAEAERTATELLREMGAATTLADPRAQAYVIIARAVYKGSQVDRYEEALQKLQAAKSIEGVSSALMGQVYSIEGDLLFIVKRHSDARYAYMRVWLSHNDEPANVAHCLVEAGKCFFNLSALEEGNDQAKSDELFKKGFRLIQECASRYRGTPARKTAVGLYRQYKPKNDKLTTGK
ncbi:MAG: hypothetical protein O7C98_06665 [Planctomycetota bacterium]|nr:hypothetical protein [Planctomycetota bacterium]